MLQSVVVDPFRSLGGGSEEGMEVKPEAGEYRRDWYFTI